MGYGKTDANEASRLNVYAAAALGDVPDALDMIDEDRKAAWEVWLNGNKRGRRGWGQDGSLI
jgi:hypothetical protein